jgi:hypothetical protein
MVKLHDVGTRYPIAIGDDEGAGFHYPNFVVQQRIPDLRDIVQFSERKPTVDIFETSYPHVIVLVLGFGKNVVFDAPFRAALSPADYKQMIELAFDESEAYCLPICAYMIELGTKTIRAAQQFLLTPLVTKRLHEFMLWQIDNARSFDVAKVNSAVAKLYQRYPDPRRMVGRGVVSCIGKNVPANPTSRRIVSDDIAELVVAISSGKVISQIIKDGPISRLASNAHYRWDIPIYDMSDIAAYQALLDEMPDDEVFFDQISKPELPFCAVLQPAAFDNRSLIVRFSEADDGIVEAVTYIKRTHWQLGMLSYNFAWNSGAMQIVNIEQSANPDSEVQAAIQVYQLYQSCLWLEARKVPVEYVMSEGQRRASAARVASGRSAISPVRVISLSAVQRAFIYLEGDEGGGTGSPKSPHDRKGHQRIWKGKVINVRPSKIHGGAQGARVTKIIP